MFRQICDAHKTRSRYRKQNLLYPTLKAEFFTVGFKLDKYIWKSLKKPKKVRKSLKKPEEVWKGSEKLEKVWKSLKRFLAHVLTIFQIFYRVKFFLLSIKKELPFGSSFSIKWAYSFAGIVGRA